jgi:hypothetical protein
MSPTSFGLRFRVSNRPSHLAAVFFAPVHVGSIADFHFENQPENSAESLLLRAGSILMANEN